MKKVLAGLAFLIGVVFLPSIIFAQTNFLAQMSQSSPSSVDPKAWAEFMRGFTAPPVSTAMLIDRIYPTTGRPGTVVTLTGHGFSQTSNKIYTGYGVMTGVASRDGKHLSFRVNYLADQLPNALTNAKSAETTKVKAMRVPLWIYVENETGLSNNKIFWLSFNPYQ